MNNFQSFYWLDWLLWRDNILGGDQIQSLRIISHSLTYCQWHILVKVPEVTQNTIRGNPKLMLTANEYFVLSVVRDVVVHGEDGCDVKFFSGNFKVGKPYPRLKTKCQRPATRTIKC
jgi:hypothetical protein